MGQTQPPLGEARSHAEDGRGGKDPPPVETLEELTAAERHADAERRAGHLHDAEGAAALGARIHALDDGGVRRTRGRAEDAGQDGEADEGPRSRGEGHQEEDPTGDKRRPDEVRERRPRSERPRPRKRQQK